MTSSANERSFVKLVDDNLFPFSTLETLADHETYQDVRLVFEDKAVAGTRLLLALALPHMGEILQGRQEEQDEDVVLLLLPQFKASEITDAVDKFLQASEIKSEREFHEVSQVKENTLLHLDQGNGSLEDRIEGHYELGETERNVVSNSELKKDNNSDDECAKQQDDISKDAICPLCDKCSDRQLNLQNHMLEFHNYVSQFGTESTKSHECKKTLWKCSQKNCRRTFKSKRLLLVHQKRHKGEFQFDCDLCPKKFVTWPAFDIHMRIHRGEFNYNCKHCRKQLVTHRGFLRHLKTHGSTELSCTCCGKKFPDEGKLKAHMKNQKLKGEETNQCRHCQKSFATKKNLKVHILNIHEKIRHFCDQCGSSYSVKQNLLNHIHEKHVDLAQKPRRTYPCKECEKRFSRPYNRCQNHQFRDKAQLLTCDRCGFSTKRAQQLHLHQVETFSFLIEMPSNSLLYV